MPNGHTLNLVSLSKLDPHILKSALVSASFETPRSQLGVAWGGPGILEPADAKVQDGGRSQLVYFLSGGVFRASSPSCSSYGERR